VLKEQERFAGRRVALIVSGGGVDESALAKVFAGEKDFGHEETT